MSTRKNTTDENTNILVQSRIYPLNYPFQARYISEGDIQGLLIHNMAYKMYI